jgi:hypothetical protein
VQRIAQSVKNYRRLGYRVVVANTPRAVLQWRAYRPRMRTPSALGTAQDLGAAMLAANHWIAADCRQCRVA